MGGNQVFYHVVKTETGDYKIFLLEKKNISGLTYNAVDLGLPSGRLWADRNVGAKSVDDYGTYFAWGETEGFTCEGVKNITAEQLCPLLQPMIGNFMELTPDNIDEILPMLGVENGDLAANGTGFTSEKAFSHDWSDYFDTTDGGSAFNKYATDKLTVLETSDDAASVNMGSNWRISTGTEMQELIDNTTHIFIDLQGNEFSQSEAQSGAIAQWDLKGVRFTGSNGNSIFIPASGSCNNSTLGDAVSGCKLWSSDLGSTRSRDARGLQFGYDSSVGTYFGSRHLGHPVRGVK